MSRLPSRARCLFTGFRFKNTEGSRDTRTGPCTGPCTGHTGTRITQTSLPVPGAPRPHCRPLRVCRTRLHFADRFRAGAGRRSGSGWRQGRVRWGRPLLSRPRGAVGSGPVAVESAAASVVALTCWVCVVGTGFGWLWFVCVVCVPLCVRVSRESRVCPGSPRCLFTAVPLAKRGSAVSGGTTRDGLITGFTG